MGEQVTQTVSFEKWTLDTSGDMFTCLQELAGQGYRGHVRTWPQPNSEEQVWDVEVNGPDEAHITAKLGAVVVLMGSVLEAMTPEQYESRFN